MSSLERQIKMWSYLRILAFVLALMLAGVAVWLLVFATTTKAQQLGALSGVWGALFGAVSFYGVRRVSAHAIDAESGGGLALRGGGGLDTLDALEMRRNYDRQLQEMFARELAKIQAAMDAQVSQLRVEVASLRGDLVEKLGGQLRLERIETTRVMGSDIEALQEEVRRLAIARESLAAGMSGRHESGDVPGRHEVGAFGPPTIDVTARSVTTPVPTIAPRPAPVAEPTPAPVMSVPTPPAPFVPPTPAPVVEPTPAPVAEPTPAPLAPPAPAPVVEPVAAAAPAPEPTFEDPFATMPRLSRFVEPEGAVVTDTASSLLTAASQESPAAGHRHAAAEDDADGSSKHSGGRRRRSDGDGNDILARLLADRRPSGPPARQ